MRTIISFGLAIFIHLGIVYFFLPRTKIDIIPEYKRANELQSIDLQKFSLKKDTPKIEFKNSANGLASSNLAIVNNNGIGNIESTTSQAVESAFISFQSPDYPRLARIKGMEGKVKVKVLFNSEGLVSKVEIVESSTHQLLDEAVKKTALTWKVKANQNLSFEKTFEFKLNN